MGSGGIAALRVFAWIGDFRVPACIFFMEVGRLNLLSRGWSFSGASARGGCDISRELFGRAISLVKKIAFLHVGNKLFFNNHKFVQLNEI